MRSAVHPFFLTWMYLALLLCLCLAGTHAQPATNAYLWAVDNQNDIIQYNPELSTGPETALETTLTSEGKSNAVAFDATRYDLYWSFSGNSGTQDAPGPGLYFWRQGVNVWDKIATLSDIGLTGEVPFNAYFFDNYYWFIVEESAILRRVKIKYDIETGLPRSVSWNSAIDDFIINGMPIDQADQKVDIALHVPTQVIYGILSNGPVSSFFKIDASDLTQRSLAYVVIKSPVGTSQNLAFNYDYSVLYGARSGPFVSINLETGDFTTLSLSTGIGNKLLRDLGGSSTRSAVGLVRNIVFGVNEFNDILEYEVDFKTSRVVLTTDLKNGNLYSNGLAFDQFRSQLFWAYTKPPVSPDDPQNGLYVWIRNDRDTVKERRIATLAEMGVTASRYPFANALFIGRSYWFILNKQPILRELPLDYDSEGLPTGVKAYIDYPLTGIRYDLIKFGDIAYDTTSSILYGAMSRRGAGYFFSIDMNTLSTTTPNVMTVIKTGNPTLQLSFTTNSRMLYGHDTQTGIWYTIDTSTGDITPADFVTYGASASSRDLAGSAFV